RAAKDSREHFDLPMPLSYELTNLTALQATPAAQLQFDPLVAAELALGAPPVGTLPERLPTKLIRAALIADLLALPAAAKDADRCKSDVRVVVLIDDIHHYGEAGKSLIEEGLNAYGLGTTGHPIPVVLSYSAIAQEIYKTGIEAMKKFVEQRHG